MSDDDTHHAVSKVVSLLAADTVSLIVDSSAMGIATAHARALDSEVKGVDVARHAVKTVFVPENASISRGGRGSDH